MACRDNNIWFLLQHLCQSSFIAQKKGKVVNYSLDYLYALDQNHSLTVLYKHPRFGTGLESFKSKIKIYEENYYNFTDKKVIEKKME